MRIVFVELADGTDLAPNVKFPARERGGLAGVLARGGAGYEGAGAGGCGAQDQGADVA
jgi:hypothetical protein